MTLFRSLTGLFIALAALPSLAGPLLALSDTLIDLMAPDGVLVLSGLLVSQAEEVIAHYAPTLSLQLDGELDGWACLVGHKN